MANNNLPAIRKTVMSPNMQAVIAQRIGDKSAMFNTSILDLFTDNPTLQECDPNAVITQALKAAALDLPISNVLGFAYVLPYKAKGGRTEPKLQMGYKGFIQLAIRTGLYKHLNADAVYQGEEILVDKIRGTMEITGQPESSNVVGYFAFMELTNGFEKAIFWTVEQVTAHAKKYSKSFNFSSSPWKSDFDAMAKKTLLKSLISKYGPLSIEMTSALSSDAGDFQAQDHEVTQEIEAHANQEPIDITPEPAPGNEPKPETPAPAPDGSQHEPVDGPDF